MNTEAIQKFVAKVSMLILRPVIQSSKVKARLDRVSQYTRIVASEKKTMTSRREAFFFCFT